jgi:predicted nucleotidyltransferase
MAQEPNDTLAALREALANRPEVLEAYLFGSTARGEQQEHSDVDVAVYVDRDAAPPTIFGYAADLTADLMRALGTNRVDVVVLNDAPPCSTAASCATGSASAAAI